MARRTFRCAGNLYESGDFVADQIFGHKSIYILYTCYVGGLKKWKFFQM